MSRPRVVFVCVQNSCRSQMAEGLARELWGEKVEVYSAGSRPSGPVDPGAVAAMRGEGIDISRQASKGLDALPDLVWDVAVTMGCGDACPNLRARHRPDWALADPKGGPPEAYRAAIADIRSRLQALTPLLADPLP